MIDINPVDHPCAPLIVSRVAIDLRGRCENLAMPASTPPDTPTNKLPAHSTQPKNPLHGLTLEAVLTRVVAQYGWPGLAERIPVRCFSSDPSLASSLKFLRKTPWARDKVEGLYLYMLRENRRRA